MSSDPRRSRILLVGFGPTTRAAFDSLLASGRLIALVRNVDDEVVAHARDSGVRVELRRSPAEIAEIVSTLRPDCVVVSSYNRILPAPVLDLCPFVNVHYAPLPRYRGRANVNWAIINRESHAAVTVHSMAPGLDAGGVLAQQLVPIASRETIGSLYERLNGVQAEILPRAVARRLAGDLGDPQNEGDATYGCTRLPEDGQIDWSAPTQEIDALIRAVGSPYPEAFTFLGLDQISVVEAEPSPDTRVFVGRVPGRVVERSAAEGWSDVLTGDGILRLRRVRASGEQQPAAQVLRSTQVTLGLRTQDLLGAIESLEARIAELVQTRPER